MRVNFVNPIVARQLIDNMVKLKLTFILATFFAVACSPLAGDTGTNTFIKESSNNRQNKKAILFLKVSALSVDSYQVTIGNSEHTLDTTDEVGNAFTVDGDHGVARLDSNSIAFTWLNDNTLQIDYDKKLRTFLQETYVNEVTIVYKPR